MKILESSSDCKEGWSLRGKKGNPGKTESHRSSGTSKEVNAEQDQKQEEGWCLPIRRKNSTDDKLSP